jgi:solute carrier family 12 sodium/potassium/chloride transporter 2
MSAQLDMIALLISDLFLITFAFLNYACFHVDLVQPVGWRPTFKVGQPILINN